MTDQTIGERAFIGLQYLLPQHFLARIAGMLARCRIGFVRTALIRAFLGHYPVDLSEAERTEAASYESFNDFFTRRLRAGVRPFDPDPRTALCPVDGFVSQSGGIAGDTVVQAKGMAYTTTALLGGDAELASEFAGGRFATLYLAPHNYHRVHMPLAGTLRIARFVPGDLFSVNTATAASVPGLFARNERVACVFDSSTGPMAVILVGALFVGSMSLAWAERLTAQGSKRPRDLPVRDPNIVLDRGALLGWFNMGSTVIVLFPSNGPAFVDGLVPGRAVRVGERLGELR